MLLSNFTEKRVEAQGEEVTFSTHLGGGRTVIQTHIGHENLASFSYPDFACCVSLQRLQTLASCSY